MQYVFSSYFCCKLLFVFSTNWYKKYNLTLTHTLFKYNFTFKSTFYKYQNIFFFCQIYMFEEKYPNITHLIANSILTKRMLAKWSLIDITFAYFNRNMQKIVSLCFSMMSNCQLLFRNLVHSNFKLWFMVAWKKLTAKVPLLTVRHKGLSAC